VSAVALTFDDGPDGVWTPRLLEVLAQHGARVTFFPIAARAVAHPALIRRMRADGHAIGLHCSAHVRHSDRDLAWIREDTRSALEQLATVGVSPTLWRTPWGDTTPDTQRIAREHGLRVVWWTADTHDWRGDTAEQMIAATGEALVAGSVVLAHDGLGPGARRDGAGETVRFVEFAARIAEQRGLALAALGTAS
jgi:peptidoglycan/xylan/chitin deacetylase (PgdA/CDA1 family)